MIKPDQKVPVYKVTLDEFERVYDWLRDAENIHLDARGKQYAFDDVLFVGYPAGHQDENPLYTGVYVKVWSYSADKDEIKVSFNHLFKVADDEAN